MKARHTVNILLTEKLWEEIKAAYNNPVRHYHTLTHLENLIEELLEVKTEIRDWDVVLFSVFYHDIEYEPTSNKNEEQSALIVEARLKMIDVRAKK